MFKSIYKNIVEDFAFLRDYGFSYSYDLKHNIFPSVVFENGKSAIEIGFNYQEHKMLILWYPSRQSCLGYIKLSETVDWKGKSYNDQVNSAKQLIKTFLNTIDLNTATL